MKKIRNFLIRILVISLLVYVVFSIFVNSGPSIDMTFSQDPKVKQTMQINIDTYKGGTLTNPDSINVSIYNKYNQSEKLELPTIAPYELDENGIEIIPEEDTYLTPELKPYTTGKFLVVLTPNFTGEYIVNVTTITDGVEYTYTDSFVVS